MIYTVKRVFQCLLTPKLYNVYRNGPIDELYKPRKSEQYADLVISIASIFRSVTFYISPFIGIYMYRQGFYTLDDMFALAKFFGGLGCFISMVLVVRAYGRASNPQYVMFLDALNSPKDNMRIYMANLSKFDFDFSAWPATFVAQHNADMLCWDNSRSFVCKFNSNLPLYKKCIVKVLAYIAAKTFALRLIYPGSLGVIHRMLRTTLVQGRAALVEENDCKRVKILTADGNALDTIFVDHREFPHPNGQILVVCSEGNSGFYEIGIMNTPLKAGYSVLGWNHPGFAGSTGLPYRNQVHTAMDAVMQYAIKSLRFQPKQIVMFGWSIGGYSSTWAACNYRVKALILDATFDDLLPLAVKQMPVSWTPLVREVVRSHINLNVGELTKNYRGPLHLIRRTDDEILCLTPGSINTNRGNYLLLKVINHRHLAEISPNIDPLIRIITKPEERRPDISDPELDPTQRALVLLVLKYSTDFRSSHCTSLPSDKFEGVLNYVLATQKYLE